MELVLAERRGTRYGVGGRADVVHGVSLHGAGEQKEYFKQLISITSNAWEGRQRR